MTWIKLAEYIEGLEGRFLHYRDKEKKMVTKLGIIALLAGFFLGLFKGISQFMGSQNFWTVLTISELIGEDNSNAVIGLIDAEIVQNSLDFLIFELPFFLFLIGIGVVLLIISLFLKNH